MDREKQKKAVAALEREKARFRRQNAWTAENFDRCSVLLPKGTKERIKATGISVNAFICQSVLDALENAKEE